MAKQSGNSGSPRTGDEAHRHLSEVGPRLKSLGRKLEDLLIDLLRSEHIRVHSVSYRVKSEHSLARKLASSPDRARDLSEVKDILGLRVITYFPDEVDTVAELAEREFAIDRENSVDKRASLDPDRFGYLSLHYVAGVSEQRSSLAEWAQFKGLGFELQIRSILQHAWAEIEHDLGYKTEAAVPKRIVRRFALLAGLLEIADDEFKQIRDEVTRYAEELPEAVSTAPSTVLIDQESMTAFVQQSSLVRELDLAVTEVAGTELVEDKNPLASAGEAQRMQSLGFKTIAEVESALRERAHLVTEFAKVWFSMKWAHRQQATGQHLPGISLFLLGYVLVAESRDLDRILTYLLDAEIHFRFDPSDPEEFVTNEDAAIVFDAYQRAVNSLSL